jgi:hypothetical protein
MTCRDEILVAAESVSKRSPMFSIEDVLSEMQRRGTTYKESTIRTHIASRMCRNAPDHHETTYRDMVRISHGLYRLA